MKKVVLIQPYFAHADPRGKPFPPMSILHVAASISHRNDLICEIVDYNIGQTVDSFLSDPEVLIFGITSFSGDCLASATGVAQKIKELRPEIPIVWGGIHVSSVPEESIREPYVDVIIKGDCEGILDDLLTAVLNHQSLRNVRGILYKEREIITNPDPKITDLNQVHPLPFQKLDLHRYDTSILWMNTSRGCPYRCEFCTNTATTERYRAMPADLVIEHLRQYLGLMKPEVVFFTDSNFFVQKKRALAIAKGIIDAGLSLKWEAHIVAADVCRLLPEDLELLRNSGCSFLVIGQDAPQNLMQQVNKPSSYAQVEFAQAYLAGAGIGMVINYIVGLPGETAGDLLSVVRDIKAREHRYHQPVNLYILYPWPGTAILNRLGKMGYPVPCGMRAWSNILLGNADILTFHSRKHRRMVQTIYYVVSLVNRRPTYIFSSVDTNKLCSLKSIGWFALYRFYLIVANLRWMSGFFQWGFEWSFLHAFAVRIHQRSLKNYHGGVKF